MDINKLYPIRLDVQCLPDSIFVSYEPFEMSVKSIDKDVLQNQSGRNLIEQMVNIFLKEEDMEIITQKNEKPQAFCKDNEVSVSFSHTDDGVTGALSLLFNVGCDMESTERTVHPGLIKRMRNKKETDQFYQENELIRIWTIKEASLKMIGTGLRKPMNSVCVSAVDRDEFEVEFDDGKQAKICSFQFKNHWISVCYQEFSDH